ncbi:MAG: ribonuclease Z [Nitrospinae bacterium]|nr:ribonuclease Z [Nitrospinota bacterium]
MELRILGSGTSTPAVERGCAGYLLRLNGKTFLVDAGPGTLRALAKNNTSLADITDIFITHTHVDHCGDLPALLFGMKYGLAAPRNDLTLYGPEGFSAFMEKLSDAYGDQLRPKDWALHTRDHATAEIMIGSVKVSTIPVEHPIAAIGYRFDGGNGKALACSGDTAPCSNIIKLAMHCEALLMECSRPDESPIAGHATTSEAAAVAKKAEVKTLILTHIYPENDTSDLEQRAARFFDGIVIAARDGMRIVI